MIVKRNMFDLTGKVALVTGGSRGLGLEIVKAFSERGAEIIIASRNLDACERAADIVRAAGCRAHAIAVNASRWGEMDRLAEASYAACGQVDILVNNAGMGPSVPSHDVTEELFDKIVGLNFKGPFRLASNVAHRMMNGHGGAIINMSSTGSMMPLPSVVPYAGAKAALNAMTVSLAREYGPKVRVNAILAGPFLTDISKAWSESSRQVSANSMHRPGRPEEIVTSALYLASPASSYVTGALVRCDGGLS